MDLKTPQVVYLPSTMVDSLANPAPAGFHFQVVHRKSMTSIYFNYFGGYP